VHHPHIAGYTMVPNFVSFAASVAGEKSRTQSNTPSLTQLI